MSELLDDTYRIDGPLGEGGAGEVLRATRVADGVAVAIKRLHTQYANHPEARTRFEREARALNGLNHPHIIQLLDFGFDDEGPYLVMELLEGRPLEDLIAGRELGPEAAFDLAIELTAGLAHAHHEGVVHRDIKPANVFVAGNARAGFTAKLIDFGLARFFDSERWADADSLTRDGAVLGTPMYMPSEQGFGQKADTRSDVYSLGVVIYEMLAGVPPFDGENRMALMRAHAMAPVRPLVEACPALQVVDPALDALLVTAMAKKPEERYENAAALLAALQDIPRPVAMV